MHTARVMGVLCALLSAGAYADCPDDGVLPITELRGESGAEREGERVLVRGVVTGDYRGGEQLDGFYIQRDAPEPAAIFVYAPGLEAGAGPVAPGVEVLVAGRAAEFRGNRQIGRVEQVMACGEPGLPEPEVLELPRADREPWREREGRLVRLAGPLTVTGNHDLARFGVLDLARGGRLFRGTNNLDHDAPAGQQARRILLDDASYSRSPRPVPFLDPEGTRRVGSTIPELTGILTHAFGEWRIHPLEPETLDFEAANPRPDRPQRRGSHRVTGFNVENYFLTLGERGAADADALAAQRKRLQAVAAGRSADVLGIVEVENDPDAVADLAEWMSRGMDRSSSLRHFGLEEPVGSDDIRVALFWDPDRVEKRGGPWIDDRGVHHRPPVAGHFRFGDSGPGKIIAVIHHKAKTGCPEEGDVDRGQGCWNERRTAQSEALAGFLREVAREAGTDRILIVGDINSYGGEDPVRALTGAGYTDLIRRHRLPEERYSYVYQGESGYIDTALASGSLEEEVRDAGFWRINADEPPELHEFGDETSSGPWRSSDHDPVWVDFEP